MENTLSIIITLILAYLTGAIPASIWTGKLFFNLDIRNHGSGNAGATNTMRVLGMKAGIPVLIFDVFKGFLATKYAVFFNLFPNAEEQVTTLSVFLGLMAVTGHIFPVYAGFKGGKGVACISGVLLALTPEATVCSFIVFLLVLFLTQYVSAGSVIAGLSFPVWIFFVFPRDEISLKVFSVFVALMILFTHKKNLERLIKGKENKATFLFKKK